MCNLGEVIARENMAEGLAKGLAEGMSKGMVNGMMTSIKNLIKNTGWPIEQALITLEVPKEDWSKYMELLTKQ